MEIDAGNHKNTRCTIYENDYGDRKKSRSHMIRIHKDRKGESVAHWKIRRRTEITSVIAEMNAANNENTKCIICKSTYKNRYSYKKHMYSAHRNGKREPLPMKILKQGSIRVSYQYGMIPIIIVALAVKRLHTSTLIKDMLQTVTLTFCKSQAAISIVNRSTSLVI